MIALIAGFFLGALTAVFLMWLTGELAAAARLVEQRERAALAQQARDHGDDPATTYWFRPDPARPAEPISRREYRALGGR